MKLQNCVQVSRSQRRRQRKEGTHERFPYETHRRRRLERERHRRVRLLFKPQSLWAGNNAKLYSAAVLQSGTQRWETAPPVSGLR